MKKQFLFLVLMAISAALCSQNVKVESTQGGFLIPKIDTSAVVSPEVGLMIFQTPGNAFYHYNGTKWEKVGASVVDDDGDTRIEATDHFFRDTIRYFLDGQEELNISRNDYGDLVVQPPFNFPGNTFYGWQSGQDNQFGTYNTAFGNNALANISQGARNTSFGARSLQKNETGNGNVSIGFETLTSNTGGSDNVAIGHEALIFNDGSRNTAIGYNSGFNNLGNGNIFIGAEAGNDEAGSNKLYIENSDADKDNALIYGEFDNNYLQVNGREVVKLIDGGSNSAITGVLEYTAVPTSDIAAILGMNNTEDYYGIGVQGLGGYIGVRGEAIGTSIGEYYGMFGISDGTNTGTNYGVYGAAEKGTKNYGIFGYGGSPFSGGNWAGFFDGRVHISDSLKVNGVGHFNGNAHVKNRVSIGIEAGNFPLNVKANGAGNDLVKFYDNSEEPDAIWHIKMNGTGDLGFTETDVADNRLVLERLGNIGIGISNPAHPLHLGTIGNGAHCTSAGVWVNGSDRRIKKEIETLTYGLDEVLKLRPVAYKMKSNDVEQIGFIAQEVREVLPELISGVEGDVGKGETLGMSYGQLTSVLVNAIKEQQAMITELKSENGQLKSELGAVNAQQNKDLDELKAALTEIQSELQKKAN